MWTKIILFRKSYIEQSTWLSSEGKSETTAQKCWSELTRDWGVFGGMSAEFSRRWWKILNVIGGKSKEILSFEGFKDGFENSFVVICRRGGEGWMMETGFGGGLECEWMGFNVESWGNNYAVPWFYRRKLEGDATRRGGSNWVKHFWEKLGTDMKDFYEK